MSTAHCHVGDCDQEPDSEGFCERHRSERDLEAVILLQDCLRAGILPRGLGGRIRVWLDQGGQVARRKMQEGAAERDARAKTGGKS